METIIGEQLQQLGQLWKEGLFLLQAEGIGLSKLEADGIELKPLRVKRLKDLRMAVIMDEFSLSCYRPECQLTELTPEGWQQEMEEAAPDLVFIESAWEGKDKLWYGKVNHCSLELRELANYCHRAKIPVVFWCKEDPVYTDVFMEAASLADVVFTTDVDCIKTYKERLEHDRVYHLHFAAQPRLHNPIETQKRKNRFCFAGSYYHKYKERSKVFDKFAEVFLQGYGFDIYDRHLGEDLPQFAFPEMYRPCIKGKLAPEDIDVAYKGYDYGVNMNSILQSQTMFARRVFELLASNTVVVGNFSRGVKNYFGDLTICTDDEKTLAAALKTYCGTAEKQDKYRLLGLRKVLQEHLYEDRLAFVMECLYGKQLKCPLPMIYVVAQPQSAEEAQRIQNSFDRQAYGKKKLVFLKGEGAPSWTDLRKQLAEGSEAYVAYFSADDWYGKNYLEDLALATRFSDAAVLGKGEFYTNASGKIVKTQKGTAYHPVSRLAARRSIIRGSQLPKACPKDTTIFRKKQMLSLDALNYCEAWYEESCPKAEDLVVIDQGLKLSSIREWEQHLQPVSLEQMDGQKMLLISPQKILEQNTAAGVKGVEITSLGDRVQISSRLPEGHYEYIFLKETVNVADVLRETGTFSMQFLGKGSLALACGMKFYDANGTSLEPNFQPIGSRKTIVPPAGAETMQILFRPKGTGTAELRGVLFNGDDSVEEEFLPRGKVLLLTNHYPSQEALYQNMFIHKRIASYQKAGLCVDVMVVKEGQRMRFWEFEGINVTEASPEVVANVAASGHYSTICVHFMNRSIWEALKPSLDSLRVLIWCHGADIQPWHRRMYNYESEEDVQKAKEQSQERMALWQEIFFAASSHNLHFVFVSRTFADEVMEDYEMNLPSERYSVIHNFIDTELFQYHAKKPESRKQILTIKPFTSNCYANDLTMKAILELSKRPFFQELEFFVYGRGKDFTRWTEPLETFENVHLHETFLTQQEIAELHQKCGIFLATTRGDTQGVSRDEAMSSGLVAIANAVEAVPEFVDESSGILVLAEDYMGIADAIERLYRDPALFQKLSKNGARHVRELSGYAETIQREVELIEGGDLPC